MITQNNSNNDQPTISNFKLLRVEKTTTCFIATILICGSRSEEVAVSSIEKANQLVKDFSLTEEMLSLSEYFYHEYKTSEDKALAEKYLRKAFFYQKRFFTRRLMGLYVD